MVLASTPAESADITAVRHAAYAARRRQREFIDDIDTLRHVMPEVMLRDGQLRHTMILLLH